MTSEMRQKLPEIPERYKFAFAAAQVTLMWFVSMQVHMLVELGGGLISDFANVTQVVASSQFVLRHRLFDSLLLEPARMEVQMDGQVLLQSMAIFEATLANMTFERHFARYWNQILADICRISQQVV